MSKDKNIKKNLIHAVSSEVEIQNRSGKTAGKSSSSEYDRVLADFKKIQDCLHQIKLEIDSKVAITDWDRNTAGIMQNVRSQIKSAESKRYFILSLTLNPAYRVATAAVFLLAISYLVFFSPINNEPRGEKIFISAQSIEQIEKSLAKNETAEYLRQSDIVIASVANMSASGSNSEAINQNVKQAKSLLMKKKYINRNLNDYELSKAQSICDQVEFILYDIVQLRETNDINSIQNVKDLIQDKNILLKIKLVQYELSDKEV
jgi:hypothetical protein